MASLIAQLVKNPPAMQETLVRFLGQEGPLETGWATHSSMLGLPFAARPVKNPPAARETWVRSLGWGDHLEKGMATHSSILAWRVQWTEESGGLQSVGSQKDTAEQLTHTSHGPERVK